MRTAEITNITTNPGLLPIRLGIGRLVKGYHTMAHYYRLDRILQQTELIKIRYEDILKTTALDKQVRDRISIPLELVSHRISIIDEKLYNVLVPRRHKRGLINGVGSLIKFITGNLDANDAEKYDSILKHLNNKHEELEEQIKNHYSISYALMDKFNENLQKINHNDQILMEEIKNLKEISSMETHVRQLETALSHQSALLQHILDVLQDIENSITFCKMGRMHPSIMSPTVLLEELNSLSKFYTNNSLLNFQREHLWELQAHIKVKCYISSEEVVYFLDVPIVRPEMYDLFLLQPVPSLIEGQYISVLPSSKFALKSENTREIKLLREPCELGTEYYLCRSNLEISRDKICETEILINGYSTNCEVVEIKIKNNYVQFLDSINQHILIFPLGDQIKIVTQTDVQILNLKGTYLLKPGNSIVTYKNNTLISANTKTYGQPLLITDLNLKFSLDEKPNVTIELKNLNYLSNNPVLPVNKYEPEASIKFYVPSLWTILLYVSLISFIIFIVINYYKQKRKLTICEQHETQQL